MEREITDGDNLEEAEAFALQLIQSALIRGCEPDLAILQERFPDTPGVYGWARRVNDLYRHLKWTLRGKGLPLLQEGERIGDFEIDSFLARGGFGEVYRARQCSLGGRGVALKVVASPVVSESDRRRFEREARIVASIHHPHLVEVYGYWEDLDRGLYYYAMRLVEGPTLRDVLEDSVNKGSPPDSRVRRSIVRRVQEVASALACLHRHGLVHRDVKPANIILEAGRGSSPLDQSAVLVDLGLVRELDASVTVSSLRLTAPYASPEQFQGGTAGPQSDVFSLGMSLCDLLAARRPRERSQAPWERRGPTSDRIPGLDPDLEAIVDRAVVPELSWRYRDAAAMQADLEAWLEGRPVSARPIRGLEAARRWVLRNPGRVLAWAARSVAVVLGGLILLLSTFLGCNSVHAVKEARAAWYEGDFSTLSRSLSQVPGFLHPLLEPEGLSDLASSIDDPDASGAVDPRVDVLDVLHDRGREQAWKAAVDHLREDGIAETPLLVRFLCHSVDAVLGSLNGETDRDEFELLRLVSDLLYHRPVEREETAELCGRLEKSLWRYITGGSRNLSARRYALSALAGCAGPDRLDRILDLVEGAAKRSGDEAIEEVRLGLWCMTSIIRRANAMDPDPQGPSWRERIDEAYLDRAVRAVEAVVDRSENGRDYGLVEALAEMLRATAFARRRGNLEPCRTELPPPLEKHTRLVLAARRDRGTRVLLKSGWIWPLAMGTCREIGRLAGSWNDPELEGSVQRRIEEGAVEEGMDPEALVMAYRKGVRTAHREIPCSVRDHRQAENPPNPRGTPPIPIQHCDPEALDRRLQARVGPLCKQVRDELDDLKGRLPGRKDYAAHRQIRFLANIHSQLHGRLVAACDFTGPDICVAGEDVRLDLPGARFVPEDLGSNPGYLLFSEPGRSQLHLRFRWPDDGGQARIHIQYLRENSALLPFFGEVYVELGIDGWWHRTTLLEGADRKAILPIRVPYECAGRESLLTVALGDSSNTSLRLRFVEIRSETMSDSRGDVRDPEPPNHQ